jgi:hypothetical protein
MAYIGPAPANSIIATSDIEDDAITTAKIVDDAVTSAKTAFTTGTFSSDVTGLTVNSTGDTSAGDNAAVGYTSAEGLILTGQGSTNDITIKRDDDTAVLEVATGQSDIEITGGNIFFGTADKGIYLGVTSATAANLLADYEEGTWTPALTFGGSTSGIVYVTQVGIYTKIGRIVSASFYLRISNNGSGSGAVLITGLPFTTLNTTAAEGGSLVTNYRGGFSADHYPGGYTSKNATNIYLQNLDPDATATSGISEADWTDTGQIYGSFTYTAA